MPELLLELFSEEIPARMQRKAAEDLRKLVTDALVERGFIYEGAKAYATPRRLALHIVGLPAKGQDVREEKKGPRVGAPEAAIQGFLKSAGLASLDQAKIESDPKKGEFYVALIERPGRATRIDEHERERAPAREPVAEPRRGKEHATSENDHRERRDEPDHDDQRTPVEGNEHGRWRSTRNAEHRHRDGRPSPGSPSGGHEAGKELV